MAIIKLITKKGLQKQINCLLNGNNYGIKYIAVGDGAGSIPTPTDEDEKLVNEVWRGEISELINNSPEYTAVTYIPESAGDFIIREIGLFDENNELLFVSQMDETPKKKISSGLIKQIGLKLTFELQNGLSAVIVDPSTVIASTNYVSENFQSLSEKAQPNGYASLDETGKVPEEQLSLYMKGDKLYYLDNNGDEQEFKQGSGGHNLFDLIYSDHILEGDEAKGKALLGTYVYKNAAPGREGYPELYNRCVEEYQNSTRLPFEQPILSADGTLGGDSFAVAASSVQTSVSGYAWKAFDGTNTASNDCWHSLSPDNQWITFYNPTPINVTKLTITNRNITTSGDWHLVKSGTVLGSDDNDNWEELVEFTNPNTTTDCGNASWDIDLSTNTGLYKYYKIEVEAMDGDSYVVIGKIEITAGDYILKHNNKHKFYDIAYKSLIDDIYYSRGEAWYYGIDIENERIFLPRSVKYFKNGTNDNVGEFGGAAIPNITGRLGINGGSTAKWWSDRGQEGSLFASSRGGGNSIGNISGGGAPFDTINIDSSRSSSVYNDDATTVDVDHTNLLVYMVVGTTEGVSAPIDAVDITTSENDTIPLGFSTYQGDGTQPSLGWSASLGQWNGDDLISFYNEYKDKVGQPFCAGYIRNYTDEYTDFDLVINQDAETFRLPLLNGSEVLPSNKKAAVTLKASGESYTAPANGWYKVRTLGASCNLTNTTTGLSSELQPTTSSSYITTVVKVKKGDEAALVYANGSIISFDFIYAKGNGTLYFKVSNATQNLQYINVAEIKNSMLTRADKAEIVGWGMPDYSAGVILTSGAAAPCDGLVILNSGTTGNANLAINGNGVLRTQDNSNNAHFMIPTPVSKGDIITANSLGSGGSIIFYPLKGVQQ